MRFPSVSVLIYLLMQRTRVIGADCCLLPADQCSTVDLDRLCASKERVGHRRDMTLHWLVEFVYTF